MLGAIDYEKDVDGFHPLNTAGGVLRTSTRQTLNLHLLLLRASV